MKNKTYELHRFKNDGGVIHWRLDSLSAYNRLGGLCDYPIYDTRKMIVLWDRPELIPKHIKKWVTGIMENDSEYLEQHLK